MGLGFGEVLIFIFMLGGGLSFPVIGSIVGIRSAMRRQREGTRSVGAVVWASIALFMSVLMLLIPPLGLLEVGVTLAWLISAVNANRAATRRAAALALAAASPPTPIA